MTWVLVIIMWGSGKAVEHIEMKQGAACAQAATYLSKKYESDDHRFFCINTVTGETQEY